MKNIILLVTLLILSITGYAKEYDKPANYGLQYKRLKADSSFKVPILTDTLRLSDVAGNGDMIYVESPTGAPDTGFWMIEKGAYVKMGANTNGLIPYSDTTPSGVIVTSYKLITELSTKMFYTDTTSLIATKYDLTTKEPTITAGTTEDVWQGDKTWTTKLGLPVSTATQTKLNDSFAKELEYVSAVPQEDTGKAWMVAAIIRPLFDTTTSQNTWSLIQDIDHRTLNVDSISATSSYVRIDFTHKAHKVGAFLFAPDESTVAAQLVTYKSTLPQYGAGGYKIGSRVFRDYVEVTISKPARIAFYLQRDSTNAVWTQASQPPATINLTSTPFTINSSTAYFDIRGEAIIAAKSAPSFHIQLGNGDTKYILDARYEVITNTWHRIWITDMAANILNVANYPHNMRILVDFGECDVAINPLTENFPPLANFWGMGILFGQRP